MNLADIARKIIEEIIYSKEGLIQDFDFNTDRQNQLLMFIKPEIFVSSCEDKWILAIKKIFEILDVYNVEIKGVYNFSGKEMERTKFIERHYNSANVFARNPLNTLSVEQRLSIYDMLQVDSCTPILGGYECLDRYKCINEENLNYMWSSKEVLKVGNNLYVQVNKIEGEEIILVNGFQPAQVEHFIKKDRHTIILLINSDVPWRIMRRYMIGNTFPNRATRGSIRNVLFTNAEEFGLDKASYFNNYVHLSSGPFEAMFEISNLCKCIEKNRYCIADLNFVRMLGARGICKDECIDIINTPEIAINGQVENLFNITEELDSYSSIELYRLYRKINRYKH